MFVDQREYIDNFTSLILDLDAIQGIGRWSVEMILAETGVEIEYFQNESRFSLWARLVPEYKESKRWVHEYGKEINA